MSTLRIFLFGPFEVFLGEERLDVNAWRSRQTRTLFRILALRYGHVVLTDQLLESLWPDDDPEAARRRLHIRISDLRRALDPTDPSAYVQTVEGGYTLNPQAGCWIDITEFEELSERGRHCQESGDRESAVEAYEAARALYRGDLLEENLYADWAFSERERLRAQFLTMLTELAECYAQQGRYRRAIAHCQQALSHDSCREAVYARLMLYYYYAGDRAQALQVYARCCRVLADELDVEPQPETSTLAEKIRDGTLWSLDGAPRYPPPAYEGRLFEVPYSLGHTPLVGREREYAWLIEKWRAPGIHVLLIEGEAGVGKSRLLDEFLGYAEGQGAPVLRSRAVPGERSSYAPVVAALRPLLQRGEGLAPQTLAALAPLFPEVRDWHADLPPLSDLPAREEQRRLFEVVGTLVRMRLPQQPPGAVCLPGLLAVDDAHRAGRACLELLSHLADTLTVVLAYRGEEAPPGHALRVALRPLERQGRLARQALERLPAAAVRTLIQQLAQVDLAGIADQVIARTDGNPLFVVALLQHLFEEGALYVDTGGHWSAIDEAIFSLPPTVRETIEARLRRLSRDQHRLFDLVAVMGGEFDSLLLQRASQQPEDLLLDAIDALLEAGLLVEPRSAGRNEYALAHDCYAEVAYDALPYVRRRQLHRRVAETMERVFAANLTPHFADLAYHFGQGGDTARERTYAELAGKEAAAQFANEQALTYLGRALELTPERDFAERYELLLAREKVYDLLGERESQLQELESLEALANTLEHDRQRAQVALRRANYFGAISDFPAMAAAAQTGIRLARACREVELEAAGNYHWGRALLWNGENEASRQPFQRALGLAQTAGLRWMEADILRNLGSIHFWQNQVADSRACFETALSIHREVGDRRGEVAALNNLALAAGRQGDAPGLTAYLKQALEICQQIGDRFAEGTVAHNLAVSLQQRGDYTAAGEYFEQALSVRREIGAREGEGETAISLGEFFRHQGDYAQAEEHCRQALRRFSEMGDRLREASSLNGLGRIALEQGDYDGARKRFERALSILRELGDPGEGRVLSDLGRLHRLLGDAEKATACGEKALSLAQDAIFPEDEAIAWTHLGHALAALEQVAEAAHAYRRALDLRRAMDQPHLATEPLAGLARLALAQGDLAQAQGRVGEILAHLESGTVCGTDEPLQVYLTCYRVLRAARDPRASEILATAYQLLQKRAATIEENALRRSFLENVAAHREIAEEHAALRAAGESPR